MLLIAGSILLCGESLIEEEGKLSSKKNLIPFKITPSLTILEVLQVYPQVWPVFKRYGMSSCSKCMGAMNETIASGTKNRGIDLNTFLNDLNYAIKNGKDISDK
ncbi:MAG: hypothetical protein PWP31_1042 [Clostridia bacterium]|nr:hypothetical protein [Clostridia bacterium]